MTFNWPGDSSHIYQGGLKGFTDGPLVVYGTLSCGIQFVDAGSAVCSGAASFTSDLAVVNDKLAYAVSHDRVLQFDGDLWTQLGGPLAGVQTASAIWADASTVVVGADEGLVFTIASGGDPVSLPGLPPELEARAVWSFGGSNIWVGSAQGQLFRYDGAQWSEMASIPYLGSDRYSVSGPSGLGRIKLWGGNGTLFAIAGNTFGQWDGTRFNVLDSLNAGAYFVGLWGNSPSEVFLAVYDAQSAASDCGPFRVRWFNGSAVGPF